MSHMFIVHEVSLSCVAVATSLICYSVTSGLRSGWVGNLFQKNFLVVVFSPGVDGICGIPLKLRSSALQTKLENRNWFRSFGSVSEFAILCLFFWTIVTVVRPVVLAEFYTLNIL